MEHETKKRNYLPIENWTKFLNEAKEEFAILLEMKCTDQVERDSFEFIKTLGKGAFGRVYLTRMKDSSTYYAIKVLEKEKVVKSKQVSHALNEKKILQALNFPFCVSLKHFFTDFSYLYYCLPFVSGGELFTLLRKMKKFEEQLAKFYAAQVLLAFEYIHYCGMIFRDLKPENILVEKNGYLKLTDFGFAKLVSGRTYTLCGTPEYLAPEIILNKGYGLSVDWWCFGVLLYEMTSGQAPFHARDPMKIYEKIISGKYAMPKFFSKNLINLVDNILQVDLSRRFGNLKNGIDDIKEHAWFNEINWLSLLNGGLPPPYTPEVRGPGDASNFDKYKETNLAVAKKDHFQYDFIDF